MVVAEQRSTDAVGRGEPEQIGVERIGQLARRWRPDVLATVTKQGSHLALDDIRDSIAELRHYREHFFRMAP